MQTFQNLTEFILNFYHVFCQSVDTKKAQLLLCGAAILCLVGKEFL